MVEVELHAEDEVGVLYGRVGDEEWHGGQGCQTVHLSHPDEEQGHGGDGEKRVHGDLVRAAL